MNSLKRIMCCSGHPEDLSYGELSNNQAAGSAPHKKKKSSKSKDPKKEKSKKSKSKEPVAKKPTVAAVDDKASISERVDPSGNGESQDQQIANQQASYRQDEEEKKLPAGESGYGGEAQEQDSPSGTNKAKKAHTGSGGENAQPPTTASVSIPQMAPQPAEMSPTEKQARDEQYQLQLQQQERLVQQQREEKRRVLIEKAPMIEMKLIDGDALPQSELIKINAFGLLSGSKRDDCEDHYVYFGSAKEMNGRIVNDVVCSKEDDFADQHFYIRYDKFKNIYQLKDLGLGSGTFLKCQTTVHTSLRNGQIIIFGENQMVVGITHGKSGDKQQVASGDVSQQDISRQNSSRTDVIVMRFIEGPKKNQQFEFLSTQAPLLIGRTDKCQVRFNDTSLSRLQCTIDFIDDRWLIKDGDGNVKPSTNGTWLFAEEEIKLEHESIIKAGLSLFKITMIM